MSIIPILLQERSKSFEKFEQCVPDVKLYEYPLSRSMHRRSA
jgi:virulence-associated protein VapD